jgi:hypothetical protein
MTLRSSKTIAKNIPVTIDRIETWIEVDSTDSKFAMTGLCEHQAGPPSFSITDPIDFSVFNKFHPHFINSTLKSHHKHEENVVTTSVGSYSHCVCWVSSVEKGSQI